MVLRAKTSKETKLGRVSAVSDENGMITAKDDDLHTSTSIVLQERLNTGDQVQGVPIINYFSL